MNKEFLGKAKGGKALAEKMTAEERKEKSTLMLKATHTGELSLGNVKTPCHVLETKVRVLSGRGMQNSLGFSNKGPGNSLQLLIANKLCVFLSEESLEKINNPIQFIRVGSGGSAPDTNGYDATILIDICDALIEARYHEGVLTEFQMQYAKQAEIIIRSVAKVGIIALIDEATGYQEDREKDALAKILEKFVVKELQPWIKTFPTDYYKELCRLWGVKFPPPNNNKFPQFFGTITNNVVYSRLAPELLPELKKTLQKLQKKATLHQLLTPEHGHPKLREHLISIVTLLKISSDKTDFLKNVDTIHPKFNPNYLLDF